MTGMVEKDRSEAIVSYVVGTANREVPEAILEAGRRAFVDYIGVAVGAAFDAPAMPVRRTVEQAGCTGKARVFMGGTSSPLFAALANGTMAHSMDFDDTHHMGAGHPSGPCWSTALAIAQEEGQDELLVMKAFLTGYEVMTRLGGGGPPGVGRSLQRRGFHPTSIWGRIGAASAACVLYGLDRAQTANALGVAATTAGGLIGSFGTHGKPFHAGKAAMDGILAAQLARNGFIAGQKLFEIEGGMLSAFIQDGNVEVPRLNFDNWEILGNSYKPFASCRATHPSSQAAIALAERVGGRPVKAVTVKVHPNAVVTAGKLDPQSALETKFSVPFCVSMGLSGYRLKATDFNDQTFNDPKVRAILKTVKLEIVEDQPNYFAIVIVELEDGEKLTSQTDIVLGHPENPMTTEEVRSKFDGLVQPVAGDRTDELFELASTIDTSGRIAQLDPLLAG